MVRVKTIGLTLLLTSVAFGSSVNAQCCSLCGKKVCVLEVSKDTEEVVKFDVKPKEICIPGIKLPWQCKRQCGGVRTVCVLEEVKDEKTVCKYDWSIKTICTSCCVKHGLKRGSRPCDVCRDDRVPFDYYAVAPAEDSPQGDASEASVPSQAATPSVWPVSAQLPAVVGQPESNSMVVEAAASLPSQQATESVSPMHKLRAIFSVLKK